MSRTGIGIVKLGAKPGLFKTIFFDFFQIKKYFSPFCTVKTSYFNNHNKNEKFKFF